MLHRIVGLASLVLFSVRRAIVAAIAVSIISLAALVLRGLRRRGAIAAAGIASAGAGHVDEFRFVQNAHDQISLIRRCGKILARQPRKRACLLVAPALTMNI